MKTFLRRLEILNYLSTRQKSRLEAVGTEVILQHLIDADYLDESASRDKSQFRLIQRDLNFLLGDKDEEGEHDNDFGLAVERGLGKSLKWSIDPYQNLNYDFEKMPAYMALALSITRKHLTQVLPASTQKELSQLFDNAESKLAQSSQKISQRHYKRLSDAVEFYQRGQSLQGPEFDMNVLDQIYQAILLGRRISMSYRTSNGLKEYELHPYGVSIMLPKVYLIAKKHGVASEESLRDENDFRSFLVHKIEDVTVSNFSNHVPETFKMSEYLAQGNMDVRVDPADSNIYQLKLRLFAQENSNLMADLRESPLSQDQEIRKDADNEYLLSASVKRTVQLRNWLLALGAQAKVEAPAMIADDLIRTLTDMQKRYS